MKKFFLLILLLLLTPSAFIALSYFLNIENTTPVKKYITTKINNTFPLVVELTGKTDLKISDGYHVFVKRLELTQFSNAFSSIVFDDFSISKKTYDDKNYILSFSQATITRSETVAKTTIDNDAALINAIYSVVSPLDIITKEAVSISIKSDKSIIITPTSDGSQEFHLTNTNIVIKENLHIDTNFSTHSNHLLLDVRLVPDNHDEFQVLIDASGKIVQNNNVLNLTSKLIIDRNTFYYDIELHLTTIDNADMDISYDVKVKRSDTTLSMVHDFTYGDFLLSGKSIFEYEDNMSTFTFLFDRYQRLMDDDPGEMNTENGNFKVVKANFTIDSSTFFANFQTEDFDTNDATSLVNFVFDASKNRRIRTDLLRDIGETHHIYMDNILYNNTRVGNLDLIINGADRHEFVTLISDDFYGGNIRLIAGFDPRLSMESNYFDITGDFKHLNLHSIITSMQGQSKYLSSGTLYGFVGIETTGVELWEMKDSMNGEIILETDNLNISSKLTKIFTTTLQQTITDMDTEDAKEVAENIKNNNVDIQCARSLLFIDNGLIVSNQETIFVTEHTNIFVSGSYNLNTELLDMGIVPNTKAFFDISASPLVKYFRVTGPLDDLTMSLDSVEILKAGASMALSYTTGPFGSMAFDVLANSSNVEIDCNRTLTR